MSPRLSAAHPWQVRTGVVMRIVESSFAGLGTWTEDGVAAMQASPAYFEFWDRWKTLTLVVAAAALGYTLGKWRR